jgi:hypothetical protein
MRNRQTIEKEMYRAREDLEANLAELRHVVAEKVNVKAQARVAYEKGKLAAQDALQRGKVVAGDLLERGKVAGRDYAIKGRDLGVDVYNGAKARPALVAGIAGGIIAVGALVYIGRQRDWW